MNKLILRTVNLSLTSRIANNLSTGFKKVSPNVEQEDKFVFCQFRTRNVGREYLPKKMSRMSSQTWCDQTQLNKKGLTQNLT